MAVYMVLLLYYCVLLLIYYLVLHIPYYCREDTIEDYRKWLHIEWKLIDIF